VRIRHITAYIATQNPHTHTQAQYNMRTESVSDRNSELHRITEQLAEMKTIMDSHSTNIADATPVVSCVCVCVCVCVRVCACAPASARVGVWVCVCGWAHENKWGCRLACLHVHIVICIFHRCVHCFSPKMQIDKQLFLCS